MIYACTVCDKNYILKGLNLYNSLLKTSGQEITLYWLCLDDETYIRLLEMKLEGVMPFSLVELEGKYDLAAIRKLPKTSYGEDYANFCWRLPPIFIDYLLEFFIPEGEKLMYADSDIFFYHSPRIILDIVGSKAIGIHTHRFGGAYQDDTLNGWYNVGVMVFTNDAMGKVVSRQWHLWMSDPTTELYKKYGSCGDQKWLNLFLPTFGHSNICVFDEEGDCSHLAPWNCTGVSHPRKHYIVYNGREQPVVFFHFSHFRIENGQWRDSLHGEWAPASDVNIKPYYQEYFQAMQSLIMPIV